MYKKKNKYTAIELQLEEVWYYTKIKTKVKIKIP